MPSPWLKACLNGVRTRDEHPALPVTAAELARDTAEVTAVGAAAVHLHVKDADGADTFGGAALADALSAVRAAAPQISVGVTTGCWALPDPAARVAAIRSWTALPDFASVNWHEPGADAVAEALLDRGIAVEAGLWHADGVRAWLDAPLRHLCLRVLIELPDGLDEPGTLAEADRLLSQVRGGTRDQPGRSMPVLLHGAGTSAWPALRHAQHLGLATRIGLEDVLELPDGSLAASNAALVIAARQLNAEVPR